MNRPAFLDDMDKLDQLDSCIGAVIDLMNPDPDGMHAQARDNLAILMDYLRTDWQDTLKRLREHGEKWCPDIGRHTS